MALLRYPGGKSRLAKRIVSMIPHSEKVITSPFMGGGHVEVEASRTGRVVKAFDILEQLVIFWQCAIEDAVRMTKLVRQWYPIVSNEQFRKAKKVALTSDDKWQVAAAFFACNRSSISALTLSTNNICKPTLFTFSAIQELERFKSENLAVNQGDFRDTIDDNFLYCDPPYVTEGNNLYGIDGNTHKDFDHKALFDILDRRDRWILSYGNHQSILDMYADYKILYPKHRYGMGNKKVGEIIIVSDDLRDQFTTLDEY